MTLCRGLSALILTVACGTIVLAAGWGLHAASGADSSGQLAAAGQQPWEAPDVEEGNNVAARRRRKHELDATIAAALRSPQPRWSGAANASAPAPPQQLLPPNAADLISTLLSDVQLDAAAAHWQGGKETLSAAFDLVRRGRGALVHAAAVPPPPLAAGGGAAAAAAATTAQQSSAAAAEVGAWLAEAEGALASLPAGPSYAALRRCVTALVLQARLAAAEQWTQSNDATSVRILRQLYELHRASAAKKSALEFYHMSKAGGTSLCMTSADEGCTTYSIEERYTCLVPKFGDGPRWINRRAHNARCRNALPDFSRCPDRIYGTLAQWGKRYQERSPQSACSERAALLAAHGWNFFASEYTLRGRGGNVESSPALCGQFLNIAIFRDPHARLLSHMRYVVRVMHDMLQQHTAAYFRGLGLRGWRKLLPAALDNFYARSLGGEALFYSKVGSLNASTHLPAARAVAASLDVLLLLEDPVRMSRLHHRWGLGWDRTMLEAEGRSRQENEEQVETVAHEVLPTGAEADELFRANSLDQQLYDFVVLLSRLDTLVWSAADRAVGDPLEGLRSNGSAQGGGGGPGGQGASAAGRRRSRGLQQTLRSETLRERRCGYVPAAPPAPSPPPLEQSDARQAGS